MNTADSKQAERVRSVFHHAERVFGNRAKAQRWLTSENRILRGVPLSLLVSDDGATIVHAELGRIEHGIFS